MPPTAATRGVVWDYAVRVTGSPVESLEVEARFAAGGGDALSIDEQAAPFVSGVVVETSRGPEPVAPQGSEWTAPCAALGCTIRYSFALRKAAVALADAETAIAAGDTIVAPPSTWLIHPEPRPGSFRFRVATSAPALFVAGTHPSATTVGSYEAATESLDGSSFAAFGDFHPVTLQRGGARVEIAIAPSHMPVQDEEVVRWLGRSVDAVAGYYGRIPFDRALLVVIAGTGVTPNRGVTLGDGGPGALLRMSPQMTPEALHDDWVATHELLHVTLPSLPHDEVWLAEGLPSYVEPFARARVGLASPEQVWQGLVDGLPQGLPGPGDQGLERTHTWGRTYWGGALFCFVADVTIREKTGNKRSLDDALRAITATGANIEQRWDVERLIDVGDRATGTSVLHDLYRDLALAPGSVDLDGLWKRLGVRRLDGRVTFDEDAPLSAVRRSMTAAR